MTWNASQGRLQLQLSSVNNGSSHDEVTIWSSPGKKAEEKRFIFAFNKLSASMYAFELTEKSIYRETIAHLSISPFCYEQTTHT